MTLQEADGSYAVQVLGPLRASLDGEELDLGGAKQQLLLALLLKECDRVVTREHLIDGLWADDPPATAKKALQVHVSNLRRAVGEEFPLRTAPGGYLIQSAGLDFDAVAFEELVTRGTALLRTDPGAACRALENALALWSGPAYANVAVAEPLATEVARLNELRLRAMTNRLDGELRLGHHAEVIGELDTLTTDQPYDEQIRALHMVALYRSGRQADALRSYQRTRTILCDELGIEPSPELRALEQQILEHSSELDLDDVGEGERYAFLATDLVASTPMWEAEPELMQRALARHDEILNDAAGANAGRVFQGTGDGVYAVFAGIADAAQAAVDAQEALDAEVWPTTQPLRVRMAVDEGQAEARGGDYFGPVLNRVSRIMSSGHGQQVLIPTVLAGAIAIPARDLGAADYKGVGRVDVSQIDIDGLPVEFPDLQTDRAPALQPRQGFGHGIRGYELREHLGEGAHGIVYRAYQASVGREVAVKAIRPEFANQPEFIKRFEAEAQYVAQLEHPHIVSLYDYWRDPEGAYLAMQWLRGGSLARSLERAPWRPPAALHLIDQIGGALTYAHRHGVIHRDLKPANVLLDEDGNAFLSDFGIATDHVEAPTAPVTSSVAYVSPEELAGDTVGVAADVYGLALLTYEILTGDRPPLGAQPASAVALRPELPVTLDEVLARATNVDPGARFARIEDFVRALRQAFGVDVVGGRVASDAEVRNPYKGLRAFAETDARDFHGREVLVQLLLQQVSTSLITTVVGPSGSGKSSLVRAGLLPAIRRGELARTGDTLITEMFPGSFPFEELEAALLRVAVDRPADLLSDLVADDRGLLRVSKQILPNDDSELLLVIDQFEEIFSLTTDDEVRRNFIDALVTVGQDDRSRVRVVLTIRADFFDRPLEYPEFGALISNGLVTVAMPSEDELAVAISQPARNAGLELEPGLVATITRDVADEPGALPLLQYALTELVAQRDGPLLTIDAYNRTGGVVGAVTLRAEEIYDGLSEGARHVAHQVFLRLVAVDRDVDDTRRRVRRVELESLGLNETALDTVLSEFGAFRLLSFDRDPVTRGPTIEVAHEALIREWPRYRNWIDERREDLLLERRLDHATTEWLSNDRDPSFLFTGGRLEQFERWSRGGDVRLTESEREYLVAAHAAADTAEHNRSSRRRRTLAVVSTLAVASLTLAIVALIQRDRADDRAVDARTQADAAAEAAAEAERAGAAEADARAAADLDRLTTLARSTGKVPREVSILAGLEAHRIAPSPDTLNAVHQALTTDPASRGTIGDTRVGGDITVLDDGRRIVLHTTDTIEMWDVAERDQIRSWPFPAAADERNLAQLRSTATGDGTLLVATAPSVTTVLNADDGEVVTTIEHSSNAIGVALSPDAKQLAIGLEDGSVEVRSVDDPSVRYATHTLDNASAPTLRWHPDGRRLALGTTDGDVGQVMLWDPDRDHVFWTVSGVLTTTFLVEQVAPQVLFSSDGSRVVVAGFDAGDDAPFDQDAIILELAADDGLLLDTIPSREVSIRSLSWLDAKETAVVTSSQNGHVEVADLESRSVRPGPPGDSGEGGASATLPDLGLLVVESSAGLDLRSIDGSSPLVRRVDLPPLNEDPLLGRIVLTGLDPIGRRLLAGLPFEPAHLIDLSEQGADWEPFTGPDGEALFYAGSAAGDRVFTTGASSVDGWVDRDWSGNPFSEPLAFDEVLSGLEYSVASPTGDRVMLTIKGEDVLFEMGPTSREIARLPSLGGPFPCCSLARFSTDGALLSRKDRQGGTQLFDAATGERIPFDPEVEAELFGPRGSWFATVDKGGTIHLHDQETGATTGDPLNGHSGPIIWFLPNRDGQWLATIGADGTAIVWDLETRRRVGRPLDAAAGGVSAWSADGLYLSIPVDDGSRTVSYIEVWNFDTDTWPDIACELAGRNMTQDEWDQYGPSTTERRATCPQYPL